MTDVSVTVTETPIEVEVGGAIGPSLYELWLANGNVGSLNDFFDAMASSFGLTITAASGSTVTTKAFLAAIPTPTNGQSAILVESDDQGSIWKFRGVDLSAEVALDEYQGMYVAPTGEDGTDGAWVRQRDHLDYYAWWFGVSEANLATNHLRMRTIEALRAEGSTVILPAGSFTGFNPTGGANEAGVSIIKSGRWTGAGYETLIERDASNIRHIFAINVSNVTFDNFRIEGAYGPLGVDGKFCIQIGTRYNNSATGAVVHNVKIRNMWIGNSDEGIRITNGGYLESDDPVWYHPKGIEITGCRIYNIGYQAFSLWGRGAHVHHNWISMNPEGSESVGGPLGAFACTFRFVGGSDSQVDHNFIEDNFGFTTFYVHASSDNSDEGVAGAEFNTARNIMVNNNRVKGLGQMARAHEFSGTIFFIDNHYNRDLDRTDEIAAFEFDNGGTDQQRGAFIVDGGHYAGFAHVCLHTGGAFKRIVFRNGSSQGNARTAAFDNSSAVFQINFEDIEGYNGEIVKPVESVEVVNWAHDGQDSLYLYGVSYDAKPAESFVEVRNCVFPYGLSFTLALPSGGVGPSENSGNVARPAGHFARLMADSTGYSHSPRYSDNNPLGGGPEIFDPDHGMTPDPVEED